MPLRKRRLPFTTGSRPTKGRPTLRPAPPPLLAAGLVAVDRARGWLPLDGCCPYRWPPLAGGLAVAGRPLQVAKPVDSMHVAAPPPQAAPTFAANHCNKHVE
ncbi:hypothetical protein GW17_00040876 [Ensete ventricosum]|nr:hypothetical protein GW17_00040876 [Ensete ventricosum]RZR87282.1 hypothetical protein BHM03_00014650 [Ensete ventricosum]